MDEKGGAVVGGVEVGFRCEREDLGKKWAARRRDEIQKVVRWGGRGIQRKITDGGGAKGPGALFACPVRMGDVLHARAQMGVVIGLDGGFRKWKGGFRWCRCDGQ